MTGNEDDLDRLAEALGIAPGFHDIDGAWHETSSETKRTLMAAMENRAPERSHAAVPIQELGPCYLPAPLRAGARIWGLTVQLYALRSQRNWGIGDFGDLRRLVSLAARHGADAVQISPLHALFPCWPDHISPYAPSSRLFLNPLYIDVEAIADYTECEAARTVVASPEFRSALDRLRAADFVDYAAVGACKLRVLRLLYDSFRERHQATPGSERGSAFQAFRAKEGEGLADFAVFEALSTRFSGSAESWQAWPAEYRDPRSPAVRRFAAAEGADDVGFSAWLQWIAVEQVCGVSALARDLGMTVGLIADLAIGSDIAGADAWRDQDLFAPQVELGAPPDPFNDKGQTWGIAPWQPLALKARAGEPLAELLRATMRWAGGIRIDHVMGLERQFWVPRGKPGSEGAYVAYPLDKLLAVLMDESSRHGCLVIGEDLGTVPEGFRERMAAAKILSIRVLYFERDPDGRFRQPGEYPYLAAVSASTHDLPTVVGFLSGLDLDARAAMGFYDMPETEQTARVQRRNAITALLAMLRAEGLLETSPGPPPALDEAEVCRAIHRFLARSACALAFIQMDDVVATAGQANLPGTTDEHPNWRRKLPIMLESLGTEPILHGIAEVMAERVSLAE